MHFQRISRPWNIEQFIFQVHWGEWNEKAVGTDSTLYFSFNLKKKNLYQFQKWYDLLAISWNLAFSWAKPCCAQWSCTLDSQEQLVNDENCFDLNYGNASKISERSNRMCIQCEHTSDEAKAYFCNSRFLKLNLNLNSLFSPKYFTK